MKNNEFKLTLPTGEKVIALSWNGGVMCHVIGEDSILRLETIPGKSVTASARYRQLPTVPLGDFPSRKKVAEIVKRLKQRRTQNIYEVRWQGRRITAFKTLKRAFSYIKSVGNAFDSLSYVTCSDYFVLITRSGIQNIAYDRSHPPKFSYKTLKKEWARIEKKRN